MPDSICALVSHRVHIGPLYLPLITAKAPVLFLKPPSSFVEQDEPGAAIEVPPGCTNLHHEVELGVVIGKRGRDIEEKDAMSYVKGWFLGLDMTARELQDKAKAGVRALDPCLLTNFFAHRISLESDSLFPFHSPTHTHPDLDPSSFSIGPALVSSEGL